MTRTFIKQALCLSITTGIILAGCKNDPPIYPVETPVNTTPVTSNPGNSFALTVSTVVAGLNKLPQPSRLCTTIDGTIYISSASQGKVYRVTSAGIIKTVLQNANQPLGIKSDVNGNIYIAVTGDNKIVKLSPTGAITNVQVDMPLKGVQDLAIGTDGTLYIADTGNKRILKVSADGVTAVLAGKTNVSGLKDGTGADAHFSFPTNIKLAADGFLWVVDGDGVNKSGQTVRRITKNGQVNTYFFLKKKGTSITDLAIAKRDKGLNPSSIENLFLVYNDNTLSHLGTNGIETVISPMTAPGFLNGDVQQSQFSNPTGISIFGTKMYIVDQNNNALRKIVNSKAN